MTTYEDNFFDVITSINTIEHLLNPGIAIQELLRITKPGGKIFVMVPNKGSLIVKIINHFFGKKMHKYYFKGIGEDKETHPIHIDYTRETFSKVILEYTDNFKFLKDSNLLPRNLRYLSLKYKEIRILEKWFKFFPLMSYDISSILVLIEK